MLLQALQDYKASFPGQKIECRVLKGNDRSPLHDRYIVIDNTAYLLGSSFNEFGTRATTLIKVPAPEVMIKKAEEWWNKNSKSIILNEFVENLNMSDDEG